MSLSDQLRKRRLVVFLGPGGVGKTTIAAATALEAARIGRRTLVLTIDPARRLADALGVKMGSEVVNVRENLDALMLDTKAALDALVRRYATTPDTLERILRSHFYEQLSDAFAGSEEFVAMGALYDLLADGTYETIIVDTPPSRHALEFLRVNKKLLRVYESGVVRYLFRPTRFLRLGGGYVAQVLARWTSSEYVGELAEFMMTFDEMFKDLETRVRAMDAILTDPAATALDLVTTAEEEAVAQTARLYAEVTGALGMTIEGCVVNRAFLAAPLPPPDLAALARTHGATTEDAAAFARDAVEASQFHAALAEDHARYAAALRAQVPVPTLTVPALPGSVHDLESLERVRAALFAT